MEEKGKESPNEPNSGFAFGAKLSQQPAISGFMFGGALNALNSNSAELKVILQKIRCGDAEEVKTLLTTGFANDENFKEKSFLVASEENQIEIMRFLIETGVNLNYIDTNVLFANNSALSLACEKNNIESVKLLIDSGIDINILGGFSLLSASTLGHIAIMTLLINAGADKDYINHGQSCLSLASERGHFEAVKLLIDSGVDFEKSLGSFALWNASSKGFIKIAKLLIDAGVDLNKGFGFLSRNPLHAACLNNKLETVKFLMGYGADENIQDSSGRVPIELTLNSEIKEFITNYNGTKFVLK